MIALDAQRQKPQLCKQTHATPHSSSPHGQGQSRLQATASATCTEEISRHQHPHRTAAFTTAAASQLASTHATHAAHLTALPRHAHALHETDATSEAAASCMHGTKRSASTHTDNASPEISHKSKQQRQQARHSARPALPGQQRQDLSRSTQAALLGQQRQQSGCSTQATVPEVQRPSQRLPQQDMSPVPAPNLQQGSELDGSCLNDTVGAIFIDASGEG